MGGTSPHRYLPVLFWGHSGECQSVTLTTHSSDPTRYLLFIQTLCVRLAHQPGAGITAPVILCPISLTLSFCLTPFWPFFSWTEVPSPFPGKSLSPPPIPTRNAKFLRTLHHFSMPQRQVPDHTAHQETWSQTWVSPYASPQPL